MAFRNDWIRSRGFSVKDLKVFITRGDSMSPTIEDKEPILINTAEKILKMGIFMQYALVK
jgi:phage repressor protein C with HTH and peptisase S24 domain